VPEHKPQSFKLRGPRLLLLGFQRHWVIWGLINGAGLMTERAMCENFPWFRAPNRSFVGGVTLPWDALP